jgi:hypothetical protein
VLLQAAFCFAAAPVICIVFAKIIGAWGLLFFLLGLLFGTFLVPLVLSGVRPPAGVRYATHLEKAMRPV